MNELFVNLVWKLNVIQSTETFGIFTIFVSKRKLSAEQITPSVLFSLSSSIRLGTFKQLMMDFFTFLVRDNKN